MDPAQEVEQHMLAKTKPIIEAAAPGDSAIQKFYEGSNIFLTGGSGFIGKFIIEKLFRTCAISTIYVLIRSKKNLNPKDRLDKILKDPVDVIYYAAANVKFDMGLGEAVLTSVRGTREALRLGRACRKLRAYVHVSTAYSHATRSREGTTVYERFHESPAPPETVIQLAESKDHAKLEDLAQCWKRDWPNTYTLSKALADEVIRTMAGNLPVCIVKPSIVVSTYCEPTPGWVDTSCVFGPSGMMIGIGLGLMHTMLMDKDKLSDLVPADMVTNAIIAAAWEIARARPTTEPKIFTLSNTRNAVYWLIPKHQQYMARGDAAEQHWEQDELLYSGRDSDDSPILSYRHERYRRYAPYIREGKTEDRERRSTFSVLAKFFLFSTAMILFCVLLYIPVYNRANDQVPKPAVAGWSIHTNRDTKIYVQPENVTTIHEPKDVCPKRNRREKNKLFLLIVVCSSTVNFEQRLAIRETWGNYGSYVKLTRLFREAEERFKNLNTSLELERTDNTTSPERNKRDVAGYAQLLPQLTKVLQTNLLHSATEAPEERRFDDEKMLPEFDMNKVLGEQDDDLDYEYGGNIMKIPPRGYEDTPDLGRIVSLLRHIKTFPKTEPAEETPTQEAVSDPDYKLVFLLGLPPNENSTDLQDRIDAEAETYSDIIQEGFVDSYNNLTLKSIMMLKWVTNNCNESVRYILKTDDDMYINVPNLVSTLRRRAAAFDNGAKGAGAKEFLLLGDLICGARPVQDSKSKWYSPRYMYPGRVYPRYLSGTGYVLSAPAAHSLYAAALTTTYFHLEDIYITGMCAARALPRLVARDEAGFSYQPVRGAAACAARARISSHRVPPPRMRRVHRALLRPDTLSGCERQRLLQVRDECRIKAARTSSARPLRQTTLAIFAISVYPWCETGHVARPQWRSGGRPEARQAPLSDRAALQMSRRQRGRGASDIPLSF
ncbi:unnamed protein product, partial [Iphiclides podalirius]